MSGDSVLKVNRTSQIGLWIAISARSTTSINNAMAFLALLINSGIVDCSAVKTAWLAECRKVLDTCNGLRHYPMQFQGV